MQDQQNKHSAEGKKDGKRIKSPYARPELKVFGRVKMLTMGASGTSSDGTMTHFNTAPSDRAVKENIVRIGDHPLGIGLYLFDYKPEHRQKWGRGRQFGVMAQEVETVMPDAVSVHPDGYKQVDYAMLGISHRIH
ncbi:MAG: hypothetical protein QG662_1405 [Pseudomonadota bacterium]|nr:hypothetical protein [Pseudomonadota bacterium]